MRLFEHPDFEQAILQAAAHFKPQGLRASIIEKDYYVTELLKILAGAISDKVVFKGGTSLSKGWNLINRFSEDIDLFLDPIAFDPPLEKKAIDRELKKVRDLVSGQSGFSFVPDMSQTIGGLGRSDWFAYSQRFGGAGEVAGRILLESGVASGRGPTVDVRLESLLARFLRETNRSLGTNDEADFVMTLLHFRRTFVEKMFAIHSKIELMKRDNRPLGPYARHYYDLFQLAAQPEVQKMLQSAEYDEIKSDYDLVSKKYFPKSYFCPKDMSFANSEALFPPINLAEIIGVEYERQCRLLCYGVFPAWSDVLACFEAIRKLL